MKLIIIITLILVVSPTFGKFQMKYGQWKGDINISLNGINMLKIAKGVFKQLPKNKKKSFIKKLNINGFDFDDPSYRFCANEDNRKDPTKNFQGQKDCKNKVIFKSPTKFKSEFTCKKNIKGNIEYQLTSDKTFEMSITTIKKNEETVVSIKGLWLKTKCDNKE